MDIRTTVYDDYSIPMEVIKVKSATDSNVTYNVKIMFNDTYSCDCKGYKFANKCWHIDHVKDRDLCLGCREDLALVGTEDGSYCMECFTED